MPFGPPLGAELLALLHRGGAGEFTATMHQWFDMGATASKSPPAARRTGFGGLGLLLDAISEGHSSTHQVSAVRVCGQRQYQIDSAFHPRRSLMTIACDGARGWQVYDDKVTVGPAESAPGQLADLADPSWLLECRLSGGEANAKSR